MRLGKTGAALAPFVLCAFAVAAAPGIYVGPKASPLEQYVAADLQRYLYVATGKVLEVRTTDTLGKDAEGVVLGTPESLPALGLQWPFGLEPPKHDGYILRSERRDNSLVVIAGATPPAVQNGVYGFLEELGFGFYLSGDTYPAQATEIKDLTHAQLNAAKSPAFAVRGTLPWFNYLAGPASWEFEDYKAYIDQLIKMRCNFVGFHVADTDPFAAFELDGKVVDGEPLANTSRPPLAPPWTGGKEGAAPLTTDHFFAGTGMYFDRERFGAASSLVAGREDAIRAAKDVLRKAVAYAKGRGMKVSIGFDVGGDPVDAACQARFEARLKALLESYPTLDYVWLWEPEGMALTAPLEPAPRSLWAAYTERWAGAFADVKEPKRRAEATRFALYVLQARQLLKAARPDVGLVASGSGGDTWLHCTDFFPGMDKVLPGDVAFAALDTIQMTPAVAEAYDKLSAERQRWPILWYEFDGDLWMPQPNLNQTAAACADALQKGCQGLLGVHWRTRSVDQTATYCARFAWDQALTVDDFCARRARDLFGADVAADLAPFLEKLDGLGYRWVGGAGQGECGPFSWQAGEEAKRAELTQVALDLRKKAVEKGLLSQLIPILPEELTGAVPGVKDLENLLPKEIKGAIPDLTKVVPVVPQLTEQIKGALVPPSVRPETRLALEDLIFQIQYVLAYDDAAKLLGPSSGLDDLVLNEKPEEAVKLIQQSKLALAMHAYARRISNKGELGVLATMNTKAWTNLRDRLGIPAEGLAPLEQLPEGFAEAKGLCVLPDRVIVYGLPEDDLRAAVKVRRLGESQSVKHPLERMGRTTFALSFPKELTGAGSIEYGIEVSGKGGAALTWPAGYPDQMMTALEATPPEAPPTPTAKAAAPEPVVVQATALPDQYCVQLTWKARDGEVYTVSGGGKALGTVSEGWFEDMAPPSGAAAEYEVVARNATGQTAAREVSANVPELPLPAPPKRVEVSTRADRVLLGWQSDAPQAAEYLVVRRNETGAVAGEMRVPADYGQYIQVSDAVKGGAAYSYAVAAVAPDGRVGAPSTQTGVIASGEPLKPVIHISIKDDASMGGLAKLAEHALVLGGRGWAGLAAQRERDPSRELTLSVWVKLDSIEGTPVLLCKGSWQQPGYFVQVLHGRYRFYVAGLGTLDAGAPTIGKWQLVTATYGHGELRLYLDGKPAGRQPTAKGAGPAPEPLIALRYGQTDEAYVVQGMLDDLRVYEAALTQGEVQALHDETKRE